MVETRTINTDAGKRCDSCGKDIFRSCQTHWLASHGEYCSVKCAETGKAELGKALAKIEAKFRREGQGA